MNFGKVVVLLERLTILFLNIMGLKLLNSVDFVNGMTGLPQLNQDVDKRNMRSKINEGQRTILDR